MQAIRTYGDTVHAVLVPLGVRPRSSGRVAAGEVWEVRLPGRQWWTGSCRRSGAMTARMQKMIKKMLTNTYELLEQRKRADDADMQLQASGKNAPCSEPAVRIVTHAERKSKQGRAERRFFRFQAHVYLRTSSVRRTSGPPPPTETSQTFSVPSPDELATVRPSAATATPLTHLL